MEDFKSKSESKLQSESDAPLWIKLFGGTILSITFVGVVTFTGFIVNNLSAIQNQINVINVELVGKTEFSGYKKNTADTLKLDNDNIVSLKEKFSSLEQLSKERTQAGEGQLSALKEELKALQKDFQALKERMVGFESKTPDK